MALFKFDRDFHWWGKNPNCAACAMALWFFARGARTIEVPDDAARDAEAAGAGKRVVYEAMQQ